MAKANTRRDRLFYLRGRKAALDEVWNALTALPYGNLTVEQKALRNGILNLVSRLLPDDSFREKRTNAELAAKYAISIRTVSNWRSQSARSRIRAGF